ncbi:DUF5133 domain-containing protein [Streptomyces rhizosphaerihabitans]|uniref:DUF5133 domain-containing protein n=1 Tax=Streptomyces rhizosphaerihabitans TaxID=1266770 RepID=UPI0028F7192E|nr:DUF5133 domain-containing protein [Streptomyces rhizosphaerihabitans]
MLVPDPKVVRRLLTRYAALKIAYAEKETLETARRLEDVTYTLCVMTGTTSVRDAVVAADAMLVAGANRRDAQPGGLLGNRTSPAVPPDGMSAVASPLTQPHTEARALNGQGVGTPGPLF